MSLLRITARFILGLMLLSGGRSTAQQLLFATDFGVPDQSFILNTGDAGSTPVGDNRWIINNLYAGGNGTLDCLGFPFSFTVPPTATQPAGITSPGGGYLHIASEAGLNSFIANCNFVAADGLCTQPANHFAAMSVDVNTSQLTEVDLSFWWLCGGGSANYGEVWYSTNGGASWSLLNEGAVQYRNAGTWVQAQITSTALAGHATVRIGFRFVNGTTVSASDPAFGIDDLRIEAPGQEELFLAATAPATALVCTGSTFIIPFIASGPWQSGNTFTAEMSDAGGGFGNPVVLGSIAATSSGAIVAVVPPGTAAGTYSIRLRSSTPPLTTEPQGVTLVVEVPASAGSDTTVYWCKNSGLYELLPTLTGADACGSWSGPNGSPFTNVFNSATDQAGVYTYTTDCGQACPADQAELTIFLQDPANAGVDVDAPLCSDAPPGSLYFLISGGQPTGAFFYNGSVFPLPDLTVPGNYSVDYVVWGLGICPNDTATIDITVNQAANAGSSTTLTVCSNDDPVALISLLGGAQTTGSWADPFNLPFSGVLVPAQAASGLYTYTVAGVPPCTNDQAFVAVIIDPCLSVDAVDARREGWLGMDQGVHRFVLSQEARDVRVRSITGQEMPVRLAGGGVDRTLPADELADGWYVLTWEQEGQRRALRFLQAR
jgi:hypothetical protein